MELPDFLRLSEADVDREKKRQEQLRRDFHSRVRQSPVELEAARAMIIESDLRAALESQTGEELKQQTRNQLADIVAAQGRFTEAAELSGDKTAKEFFTKAADAVFSNEECNCTGQLEMVGNRQIRLPRYRVIKEIYSIKTGQYGFLAECNICKNWIFLATDPTPIPATDAQGNPLSDLDLLKP